MEPGTPVPLHVKRRWPRTGHALGFDVMTLLLHDYSTIDVRSGALALGTHSHLRPHYFSLEAWPRQIPCWLMRGFHRSSTL